MADFTLPRYNLPQPQLPGGMVPVSPVLERQPLDSLSQGIQQGSQLGLAMRQQQRIEEQMAIQEKERQAAQKTKDFEAFGTSIKTLKGLPDKLKPTYWQSIVYPVGKQLGLEITPTWEPDIDNNVANDVATIFDLHKKDPKAYTREDVINHIQELGYKYQMEGQETTANYLQKVSEDQRKAQETEDKQNSVKNENFNVKTAADMAKTISGNVKMRNTMSLNQQKLNNIGAAKALIDQVEGQPGGADQRQMFEISLATVRSLMSNNTLTEGEIKMMMPQTYKGSINKFIEKVTNDPTGMDAQNFVSRYKDTLKREYTTSSGQVETARKELLGGYLKWAEDNPQYSTPVLASFGIGHPTLNPNPAKQENIFDIPNNQGGNEVPSIGQSFQGSKVKKVRQIK